VQRGRVARRQAEFAKHIAMYLYMVIEARSCYSRAASWGGDD